MNYSMLFVALLGFNAGALFVFLLARHYWTQTLDDLRYEQECIDRELRMLDEAVADLRAHLGLDSQSSEGEDTAP